MSTEDKPFFDDPHAALREIAQNPDAYAHYLADFHRVVLDMQAKLEVLQHETRVHCRGTRVEGDKWKQAQLRSFPVEKSLNDVIRNLRKATSGLEKSAHKRHAHDEKVKWVKKQRKEKALLKERKNNPPLEATPESPDQQSVQNPNRDYGSPTSIYDLDRRESA
ncbi:hypothetical protein PV411_36490 [Streptomyces sp. NRRL_B-16638]|uniref:Uncharacterized protein n=2 Tax=Streptomyces coelicolor TaxID=1902 RepID=Q9AD51_STRCO|nr:hypothetical protein [Streptomyces sp. NRRL_B-16638]AGO88561.1 hypothetical protein [Streptomyces coelicolor]MDX2929990.1 hypothetical protein [Streptomyces sp. NRRL_B-16638]CAC36620.1 hypothetical protein [Streptomyces coelicolor A3(2)]